MLHRAWLACLGYFEMKEKIPESRDLKKDDAVKVLPGKWLFSH